MLATFRDRIGIRGIMTGSIVDTIAKFKGAHCAVFFRRELAGFQEARPLFKEREILT